MHVIGEYITGILKFKYYIRSGESKVSHSRFVYEINFLNCIDLEYQNRIIRLL